MSSFVTKTTRTTVSEETGKVLDSKTVDELIRYKNSKGIKYVAIIEEGLHLINNLTANEIKVLIHLSMDLSFKSDNFVDISQYKRKEISNKLGISNGSFRNILSSLRKKDLLKTNCASQFKINPGVLYRGTVNSIPNELSDYNSMS
ncbi:replication/maintenance protein RepL [Pseudoalteromonas sp. SR43-2]|uniref:helix-turn-helix transcriptional regulator n=1 Tax=Pseudoalteromonas sp. SR43-2 TaxID=2760944 RepID=UPI0015F8094D|nr:replication/maintenance protein RepL [Pseudoalteromonas sp. SR43-2]MBB1378599.1 replication/maintenance protein RepL [Pseudoalteromonas sp. SR43-2]